MKIDITEKELHVLRDSMGYSLQEGLFTKIRRERPDKQGTLERLYQDFSVIERNWPAMQARLDRG